MTSRLAWAGDGSLIVAWAPARDLDSADLARLVYQRTVGTQEGTSAGLYPEDPGFVVALGQVVAGLLSSGLYTDPDATLPPPPEPTPPPLVTAGLAPETEENGA